MTSNVKMRNRLQEATRRLKELELTGDEQEAPPMCSKQYCGFLSADLVEREGTYYMTRGSTTVALCKPAHRVIASNRYLRKVGNTLTHTELMVQKATFQFLLGEEPVVPFVFYIQTDVLTFCARRGISKIQHLAHCIIEGTPEVDKLRYDATTLEKVDSQYIDRDDIIHEEPEMQDVGEQMAYADAYGEIVEPVTQVQSVGIGGNVPKIRARGYVLSSDPDVLAYFPPPRVRVHQRGKDTRVLQPGVLVEPGAVHVMTPQSVSIKACRILKYDGAQEVFDVCSGYGSDAANFQRLPITLHINDIDQNRMDATIQNLLWRGQGNSALVSTTMEIGRMLDSIKEMRALNLTYPRVLVYLDPPWTMLVFHQGRATDFQFKRGLLSSYLASMYQESFLVKVPVGYDAQTLSGMRMPTREWKFFRLSIKLLYYERKVVGMDCYT